MSGQSQFLTTPVPARSLNFNLSLEDPSYGEDDLSVQRLEDSDDRLVQMLASQARLKGDTATGGEDEILGDKTLSDSEKREALQGMFTMAASNGHLDRINSFLEGPARQWIDLNAPDADGTPPLIYASCFGHQDAVAVLLDAGASVNKQDKNQWSSLMWAMTNRHKAIAKLLLG